MNKKIKTLLAGVILSVGASYANTASAQEKSSPDEEWWPFVSGYLGHYYKGPARKYMMFTVCNRIIVMVGLDPEGNLTFVPAHPMHKPLYEAIVKYENNGGRTVGADISEQLGLVCPESI